MNDLAAPLQEEANTAFRQEVREWLAANFPSELANQDNTLATIEGNAALSPPAEKWKTAMGEKGWGTPTWPAEYGGGGLNRKQTKILQEEMAAIGAWNPIGGMGVMMLGPTLLEFASEEQKHQHIPPICRGEIRWCQGYSEPGAGSDLAALQMRAEDKGDHYLVNGQKIWTSYADKADWIFCLVRTDNSGTKHEGISFLLFDMASEGVTTRPIKLISGSSPFCETFFDNVEVPKANLMGEEGKGWTIAKYLLTHEREMISGFGVSGSGRSLGQTAAEIVGTDATGRLRDSALRHDVAQFQLDSLAFGATMARDVEAFELMKLRMLNGSHSTMSYLGYLGGKTYVSEAIADPGLRALIHGLMTEEVMPTLSMPRAELEAYRDALLARFANPALRHRTWQIAMDGSQKLPQRLLGTIRARLAAGQSYSRLALGVAAWMRYVTGIDETGAPIDVKDPFAARLRSIADATGPDAEQLATGLLSVTEIFGTDLPANPDFRSTVTTHLRSLFERGALATAEGAA